MRTRTVLTTAALVTALALPTSLPAFAGDNDVRRSGNCSGRSDWKLKLSPEDGRLEVEFEVDQNVNGDTWRIVMRHDGNRFFRGRRTTRGPSGSFEVRRVVNNNAGTDRFTARARNLSTDEVCRGSASI
jgi:catechol 2,3-dioxygenase-like lactoylglutathione lyase family enzyme